MIWTNWKMAGICRCWLKGRNAYVIQKQIACDWHERGQIGGVGLRTKIIAIHSREKEIQIYYMDWIAIHAEIFGLLSSRILAYFNLGAHLLFLCFAWLVLWSGWMKTVIICYYVICFLRAQSAKISKNLLMNEMVCNHCINFSTSLKCKFYSSSLSLEIRWDKWNNKKKKRKITLWHGQTISFPPEYNDSM